MRNNNNTLHSEFKMLSERRIIFAQSCTNLTILNSRGVRLEARSEERGGFWNRPASVRTFRGNVGVKWGGDLRKVQQLVSFISTRHTSLTFGCSNSFSIVRFSSYDLSWVMTSLTVTIIKPGVWKRLMFRSMKWGNPTNLRIVRANANPKKSHR